MSTRLSAATRPAVLSSSSHHLANRFSYGVSESMRADIARAGSASRWFEKQLSPTKISDSAADRVIGWFPHLLDSPATAWENAKSQEHGAWEYGFDLSCYTIARRLTSKRQVHEVMTDFWSNLLHIPVAEDRSFPWRYSYDQMIRKYALSSFRSLLRHAVVHPAMSGWLNNSDNTKYGINENLGRELLELYTVGRPAGYDEDDVKNSARILTGFNVAVFEDFSARYSTSDHYTGTIKVLGFTHANTSRDGRAAVNAYLDYLARHPATAKRIATRLCVRFVSDTPSASIVSAVQKAYTKHDTDIKAALRALVAHPDFKASRHRKFRTPIEDVVNAARLLSMKPTGATGDNAFVKQVIWMGQNVGQSPFDWPRPDGSPESSVVWGSPARMLRSWGIHYDLAGGWWVPSNVSVPAPKDLMPTSWPRTLPEMVEHQSRMLLGRTPSVELVTSIAAILNVPVSYRFQTAANVTDWAWTVIRGSVLNAPEGIMR